MLIYAVHVQISPTLKIIESTAVTQYAIYFQCINKSIKTKPMTVLKIL